MNPATLSFEFFPPRSQDGIDQFRIACAELQQLDPEFYSVTFGAGGSTREGTFDSVKEILQRGIEGAPHISCVGASRESIRELLTDYRQLSIKRIVAVRGDLPSGMLDRGDFRYACDLVRFIREEMGADLHIQVAAYPEFHPDARSPAQDIENFKLKIEAGADSALTQYFYNADAYFRFVDSCADRGLEVPIIPGIMPITNYKSLMRFSHICGAEIPRWILLRLEELRQDLPALREFGADVTARLCETLINGGAPSLHFYTLNRHQPVLEICRRFIPDLING